MRIPVIKHVGKFLDEYDQDYVEETIQLLEFITESRSIKDEELDVIGELISNLSGAIEVRRMQNEDGLSEKDALNGFMQRVMGSIDQ